jgi:CRP-like cAMP-binding protein
MGVTGQAPQKHFDVRAFLDSAGVSRRIVSDKRAATLFAQGQPSDTVLYIQRGRVKLSVFSPTGREAIVGSLGPGDFCGEGCLAGQLVRMATATALTATTVMSIDKAEMMRALHAEHALSDRFIAHMLSRNLRVEADLIDQLFNSTEQRLARVLLVLARYGSQARPRRVVPTISPATLADMAGTTRARAGAFLTKFKRLGFIEGGAAGLTINPSLLTVVLSEH